MPVITLVIRVVVGVLALARGAQKLTSLDETEAEFQHVGFRGARRVALAVGLLQVLGGSLLVAGVLVPLAAALIIGIAVNALFVRGQEAGWGSAGVIVDGLLLAGALGLGFIGPGALALERAWDWEVGGDATGMGAVVLGALVAAAGTQIRDARKVKARREGTEDEVEPLGSTPLDPLGPEEASDPAASTEGESHSDPIRHRDETEGPPDVDDEDDRERTEPQRELGSPPIPPLDPNTATDPGESTEGESPDDPVKERPDER